MNTFTHKQLFMIILLVAAVLGILAGSWGIVYYDEDAVSTTTAPTGDTTDTSMTTDTTDPTDTTASSDVTYPPVTVPPITTVESTTVVVPSRPKPTGKIIALTFDDGPSLYYTPEILDLLEKYNARATFFVNGYQLTAEKSASLRRAIALGCEIGNHTENHANLTKLSAREIYEEIQATNDAVKTLCGYEMTLLRPPGGNINLSVMNAMYDAGLRMHTIMWNNDSMDWSFNGNYVSGEITREEAIQQTYDMIMGYPLDGAIVLMHDIKGITPDVLELLLQKLTAEGYTFVTVSEMFEFESMGKDAYFTKFYADDYYIKLK